MFRQYNLRRWGSKYDGTKRTQRKTGKTWIIGNSLNLIKAMENTNIVQTC